MGFVVPLVTLVGAGVSAYSQYSAGKAQAKTAQFNHAIEASNARLNQMAQQAAIEQQRSQSALALRQAEINHQLQTQEAAARTRNAQLIRQNAEARTSDSREAIRRKRLEFARFTGMQRNRIAASGVVGSSGSPLEMLAETAGKMQLALEGMHHQTNIDRATQMNQAEMEDFGARLATSGADSSLAIAGAASRLRSTGFDLQAANVTSRYQSAIAGADINRMVGVNQGTGQKYAAAGTLFTGVGASATQRYNFKDQGVTGRKFTYAGGG